MIEFISYDGKYPHLCSGVLMVRIDGQLYAFCSVSRHDTTHFRLFWKGRECVKNIDSIVKVIGVYFESGGTCDWDNMTETNGRWTIDFGHAQCYDGKPFLIKGIKSELEDVMNAHVEWGCCGGCF